LSAPQAPESSGAGVRRIGGVITALITVGVLALLLAGLFAVKTLREAETQAELVRHTREVEALVASIGIQVERSEASRRGYLIQRDPRFRDSWDLAIRTLEAELPRLEQQVGDNERQAERARALQAMVTDLQQIDRQSMNAIDSGAVQQALTAFTSDRSADLLRTIRAVRLEMAGVEAQLLEQRDHDRIETLNSSYAILAFCALLVLAIIAAAILVIRRYTIELARSRDVLHRLNTDLEGLVGERTNELQRANEEIQRFAYIVSHDLRSPLVNVMGFTAELEAATEPLARLVAAAEERAPELVTREAKLAVEEDLPEAARFIRASTEKMDRLITAVLTLSRQGRRVLTPEPLDVTALVGNAVSTLRHLVDEAGAEITVGQLPSISSDRVAIYQIFSNLIENAVKYLKPGRAGQIAVSGRAQQGGRVLFEIKDNGRGIDGKDHERIFDLFRRSGQQDRPGEGIGLAHVRSLVWRLGGTIEVESALDEGATFRLSLPLNLNEEEAG